MLAISASTALLGALAAFCAGFVDAIVGGGGLIQLPAVTVLLPSSTATDVVLGTNKLAAAAGTSTAAFTYRRRLPAGRQLLVLGLVAAVVASFAGARLSSLVPRSTFRPVVVVVLVGVLVLTLRRPQLGMRAAGGVSPGSQRWRLLGIAAVVGFYDGLIGPGTGTFFTIALVLLIGFDFLAATATAKVLNLGTNLAALGWYLPHDAVVWSLAVPMALANLVGGFTGAHLSLRRGVGFVRAFFVSVVSALIIKLLVDIVRG